jgi:hypothetical protein
VIRHELPEGNRRSGREGRALVLFFLKTDDRNHFQPVSFFYQTIYQVYIGRINRPIRPKYLFWSYLEPNYVHVPIFGSRLDHTGPGIASEIPTGAEGLDWQFERSTLNYDAVRYKLLTICLYNLVPDYTEGYLPYVGCS